MSQNEKKTHPKKINRDTPQKKKEVSGKPLDSPPRILGDTAIADPPHAFPACVVLGLKLRLGALVTTWNVVESTKKKTPWILGQKKHDTAGRVLFHPTIWYKMNMSNRCSQALFCIYMLNIMSCIYCK